MKKLLFFTIFSLISVLGYTQNGGNDSTFNLDDIGFGSGIGFNSDVNSIVLQNDEKIIVGGGFNSYNGIDLSRIGRLNSDGTIDTTFVLFGVLVPLLAEVD
ncbi:MAG: delta-60 repeat domain-containing protein [Brumimicrobium sp.]|nr:delta-60 repeat domain-containing protein [Brumimicrobium sp.]